MLESIDFDKPINQFFPVPKHLYYKDIAYLRAVAREEDSKPNLSGLINCLRASGHKTFKDLLDSTWRDLYRVRNLGFKRQVLLVELLKRVTKDPESVEKFTPGIKKPTRSALLNTILERNNVLAREKIRLNTTEQRLRDLGVIHFNDSVSRNHHSQK